MFVPDWLAGDAGGSSVAAAPAGSDAGVQDATTRIFAPVQKEPALARPARPLLIRGAHCVIPAEGVFPLDVRVEDGIIQSIGQALPDDGCDVVGAQGMYLLPGIVDPHVHLGLFASFDEEAFTETRSAVLNGVTTLGAYVISQEPYSGLLDSMIESLDRLAAADVFLHLPIFNEAQLKEVPLYASRYGVMSFKAYMTGIPGIIPSLDEGFLLDLMAAVAALGPPAVLNIHAENHHIVDWATGRTKRARPRLQSLEEWSETHPAFAEAEAVQRAALLAEQTGARVYFVHISSAEGATMVRALKRDRRPVWAETTSPYLTMTAETALGALAKMVPPLRTEADRLALWHALKEDVIDTVGTDHTPLTVEQKRAGAPDLWETVPGYPAVGTHLPSLLDEARRQNYPLVKLVEKLALNPARIFGLYPRKGTLLPGSDADLVIVDPVREQVVSPGIAASRADYALRQTERLIGWPVAVFKGGRPVCRDELRDGRALVRGRYLRRS